MNKTVKVEKNFAYGNVRYYPKCDMSKLLCKIKRTKTLNEEDFDLLRKEGFEVQIAIKDRDSLDGYL